MFEKESANGLLDSPIAGGKPAGRRAAVFMAMAPADMPDRVTLAAELVCTGHPERAYAIALEAHEQGLHDADDVMTGSSADCLAYAGLLIGRYEHAIRFARIGAAIWQRRGDRLLESRSRATMAMLLATVGEADGLVEADAAVTLAEAAAQEQQGELGWALQAKCLALVLLKHADAALPFGERAVALGRRGVPVIWAYVSLSEAIVWSRLSEESDPADPDLRRCVEQALLLTQEGRSLAHDAADGWLERLLTTNIAEYSLYIGDVGTAEQALADAARIAGEPTNFIRGNHLLQRGRVLAAQRRYSEALESWQEGRRILNDDNLELLAGILDNMVDVHEVLGDFKAALDTHRAYHRVFARRASESAARRARLSALQQEADELRAVAAEAQGKLAGLAAHNELLAGEATRLLRTSLEDPLTGLPNRRQLNEAFVDAMASGDHFVLAMVDVDHFKQVNDRFSHPVGDAVLRSLATILTEQVRSTDLAARFGGEEFALLLRHCELGVAVTICERVRSSVETWNWRALRDGLAVTISIGLATIAEAATTEALVALADLRLYAAKRGGRNAVVAFGGSVAPQPA